MRILEGIYYDGRRQQEDSTFIQNTQHAPQIFDLIPHLSKLPLQHRFDQERPTALARALSNCLRRGEATRPSRRKIFRNF
jgi:hypothetical protein